MTSLSSVTHLSQSLNTLYNCYLSPHATRPARQRLRSTGVSTSLRFPFAFLGSDELLQFIATHETQRQRHDEKKKESTNDARYPPRRTVIHVDARMGSLSPSENTLRIKDSPKTNDRNADKHYWQYPFAWRNKEGEECHDHQYPH
jgi:hypothetical protein